MNTTDLIKKISDSPELKALVEKVVNEYSEKKSGGRWKPGNGQLYFSMGDTSGAYYYSWDGDEWDIFCYETGDCFKTREEAEAHKEKRIIKQELEDLALELNNGELPRWEDPCQYKYYLCYDHSTGTFLRGDTRDYQHEGTTYCLSENFLEEAKKRIGKDRLLKLFK